MRALPVACLWLMCLLPAAVGQEAFSDPDFDFSMHLPVGMRSVTEAEREAMLNVGPGQTRNVARGEAAGAPVIHYYIWVDETTPYNRQVNLGLYDGEPPYKSPAELKEDKIKGGLAVEVGPKLLSQPANAVYLEGTLTLAVDKTPLRRIVLYIPDFASRRYAFMTLQAYAADWDIVKPDLDAVVSSVKMRLTKLDASRVPTGDSPGAGKRSSARREGADTNSWTSLPVAGSLLLAAVVIGSLVLGRRKPA